MVDIFLGLLKSQNIFGVLEIADIFGVGPSLRLKKNESTPPPPGY